jgi:hypothetical protein
MFGNLNDNFPAISTSHFGEKFIKNYCVVTRILPHMMRLLLNTQLTQHASSASNCMPVQCRTSLIPVAAPSISSRCYDAFSYNARDLRSRDCRSDRLAVVARATDTDSSNGDEEDADQMWDADTSEEELLDEDFSNVKILGTEEDE